MIILQDERFFNHNLARYAFSQKILKELNFQFKSIHGIKGSDLWRHSSLHELKQLEIKSRMSDVNALRMQYLHDHLKKFCKKLQKGHNT